MLVGTRDEIGSVLFYHIPHLPELVGFVSAMLLRSSRLLVLGDFSIHATAEVTGPAREFLETMDFLDISQYVNSPTHVVDHTLDLVFSAEQEESDPRVVLPSCREMGPIKMVCPCRI